LLSFEDEIESASGHGDLLSFDEQAAGADAAAAGDTAGEQRFNQMVETFKAQLDESNPVLTAISDAMTAEGVALERGDAAEAQRWATEKAKGNEDLQAISLKYKLRMRELREGVSA